MTDGWRIVEAVGTVGGALVGAAVLGVAVYQLGLLRRQVGDAAKGVEAARLSADAAREATVEASKARADANAPRLVVQVSDPAWPPMLDRTRSGMPQANDLRLLDTRSLHQGELVDSGRTFQFDRDRHLFLWFKLAGSVTNEGSGSARVRLDGEAQFEGHRLRDEVVLRPGERKGFEWGTGLALTDWADQHEHYRPGRNNLTVTSMDYQEHGVLDHVYVELGGRALEPEPGVTSGWRITSPESLAVTVYPTRRTYRWEWPDRRRPTPWEE
jgi:hypothetical protein